MPSTTPAPKTTDVFARLSYLHYAVRFKKNGTSDEITLMQDYKNVLKEAVEYNRTKKEAQETERREWRERRCVNNILRDVETIKKSALVREYGRQPSDELIMKIRGLI